MQHVALRFADCLAEQGMGNCSEPWLGLRDEPTGNLDNTNAWEIMHLLEEINERGTTVVVVTHNSEIVKKMNKRVITIKKGVVVSDGKWGDTHEV